MYALPSSSDISSSVESLEYEAIEMLKEFVSHPSLLGQELSAQEFIKSKFLSLNHPELDVKVLPICRNQISNKVGFSPVIDWGYYDQDKEKNDGKVSVIATHRPSGPVLGKSLIFNGHVDVVPTGPIESWTNHPFSPWIENGRLYGRGAGDMKAGIVSYYIAFKSLMKLGYLPAAPVQMQTVVEEECTGNGALSIVDQFQADAVIIPEPFAQTIVTAQLGVLWIRIHVIGKPAHVLDTSAGINAIEASYQLVKALKILEQSWNDPSRIPPSFKDFSHPINFNFAKITAGEWTSSVPLSSTFELRIGFFPEQSIEEVKKDLENVLEKVAQEIKVKYRVEYNGFHAQGVYFPDPSKSSFIQTLAHSHKLIMNQEPELKPVTCTTDGRFYQLYHNMPTTCYGPEATNIHAIDESVSIESMIQVSKVLAIFISKWCQLEPINASKIDH